jgi:hypothetical protein
VSNRHQSSSLVSQSARNDHSKMRLPRLETIPQRLAQSTGFFVQQGLSSAVHAGPLGVEPTLSRRRRGKHTRHGKLLLSPRAVYHRLRVSAATGSAPAKTSGSASHRHRGKA